MDRRKFLRSLALTGAAAVGGTVAIKEDGKMGILTQSVNAQTKRRAAANYDLVAVLGGEPEAMFLKAIAEMGGMGKFIKKGDKVVVKPNIGWDKTPELAANTNPKLVSAVIKECFKAGAKEVVVFDHTCDDWRKAYANSGIEAAAKAAGAKVVPAHQESYYRQVSLPNGKSLKSTKIHEAIVNCDKWINIPVLKNHGGAQMTIAMKNYMGIVWDRGFFHANDLQQCIADVCTYAKRPVLNIVDAYRLMKTSGPRGRSAADVVLTKGLFLSQDIVAVDTAAVNFFSQVRDMPLNKVTHISKAQDHKLGIMDLSKLKVRRVRV
ncbi:MAG: DUF362 domain-containing protein [Porphyromonadaceae bacterium]|nr:DUF362 domain-containing protein [Porphyromonadaceae bacterium]